MLGMSPTAGVRVGAGVVAGLLLVAASALAPVWAGGSKPPPGRLAGWHRVFVDDFAHGLSTSKWGRYSGQPAGDPGGWWEPSHAFVRGGMLWLDTYRDPAAGNRWVSGGVSSSPALKQTYGKYLVRFRMDGGKGVSGVLLLWPVADHWPPEVDFVESGGTSSSRDSVAATLHHGAENQEVQRSVRANFSRWHTAGVEWTPGRLTYTLDGRRWATVRGAGVPHERMEMDIQAQAGTCGDPSAPCPDATTPSHVRLQVDWVAAYAYRPASRG
jgi:beta-glucanase (GH16 family)